MPTIDLPTDICRLPHTSRDPTQVNYRVVVSAENNDYLTWQTQLFCFSAISRLNQAPIIIVHKSDEPLRREFHQLKRCGCTVIEAPSFRLHRTGLYAPRNELGSLFTLGSVLELDQPVLFCEPDMLFVSPIHYDECLTGEYYSYMNYSEDRVRAAAQKLGAERLIKDLNNFGKIGVPYLIPGRVVRRLSERWLEALDSFDELRWIDIMYAFGLALAMDGLEAHTSHIMNHNFWPLERLTRRLIHYCYGNALWNKRSFRLGRTPLDPHEAIVADVPANSIIDEIMRQISEARLFFARVT